MSTNAIPVFDHDKLRRRAMGDPAHQVELLALFVAEAERLMRQLEDASSIEIRVERLRALVALSRNVGATLLAHEAHNLETQIATAPADLEPLHAAVAQTLAFVRRAEG